MSDTTVSTATAGTLGLPRLAGTTASAPAGADSKRRSHKAITVSWRRPISPATGRTPQARWHPTMWTDILRRVKIALGKFKFRCSLTCLLVVAVVGMGLHADAAVAQTGEETPPPGSNSSGPFESDPDSDGGTGHVGIADDGDESDSGEHDTEFEAELREFLDEDLDERSTGSLPINSTDMITVGAVTEGHVRIGLPDEAQLNETGSVRNVSEVVYESSKDLQVEVATVSGEGTRVIAVIDGSNAPTTYTFPLNVPKDVKLLVADGVGNALLAGKDVNGNETPIGYIDVPWAYDANGNTIPVTQTITRTSITLTVQHANAVYPVYADPTYYHINCDYGYSTQYSTQNYLRVNGVCPQYPNFYYNRNYWPMGSSSIGEHRTLRRDGGCSHVSDTGLTFDFRVPCRTHDYCWDLVREDYPYVSRNTCDNYFKSDMAIACRNQWDDWWEVALLASCASQAAIYGFAVDVWPFDP